MQATVADESEELAVELPVSAPVDEAAITTNGDETIIDGPADGDVDGDVDMTAPPKQEEKEEEKVEDPNKLPDDACETLYLQNLNEKVRISGEPSLTQPYHINPRLCGCGYFLAVMKETLASLFRTYRPLLPIVAHHNVRMRGQAFVTFQDVEAANRAKKDVSEFPLYGKGIVSLTPTCCLSVMC